MSEPWPIVLTALIAALAGVVPAILVAWINQRHETKRARERLLVETALENFKFGHEIARRFKGPGTLKVSPLQTVIIQQILLSRLFDVKNPSLDTIEAKVAEIDAILDRLERYETPGDLRRDEEEERAE